MKKIIFYLLIPASLFAAVGGTITFWQNAGNELGSRTSTQPGPPGLGFLEVSHGPATFGLSASSYNAVGVTLTANSISVEAQTQVPFHAAGSMSGLYAMVSNNSLTQGATIYLRINGINATEHLYIGAATIGEFHDTIDIDAIHVGNLVDYQILTPSGGTGTISLTGLAIVFTAQTNNMMPFVGGFGPASSTNGFANYFMTVSGFNNASDQTESSEQYQIKTPGTFSNLGIYVSVNNRTQGTSTFRLRHNGANGNEVITIPQGGTGLFEDNTDIDTVVAGDTVTYELTMDQGNGSNAMAWNLNMSEFTTSGNVMEYPAQTNGHAFNIGDTNIMPIQGALGYDASETNDYNVLSQVAGTFSNMHCYVQSNSLTQATTIYLRINGANGNSHLFIPAGVAGYFEDTTDQDSVTAASELDYKETVTNSGTGTAPFNYLGAKFTHS